MIKLKTKTTPAADDYLEMIRAFPLRKIANDAQYAEAMSVLRSLARGGGGTPLTPGQDEYFDALATLIEEYERPSAGPDKTPIERLKHLMDEGDLGVQDIGEIIGSVSAASLILRGQREISKAQAKRLGDYFRIDPGAFIF